MFEQIKRLLEKTDVRDAVRSASSREAAVKTLVDAGSSQGLSFTVAGVSRALEAMNPMRSRGLSESELLMVSGGMPSDSAPKLCHTSSCGGNHAGCCWSG
jgi:hypothetical protein